ncbi:PE-PPE domain-containing protein [Mycolicibacterium komossense]|uniref:PE-PPE domain-containing protein n=1 Tax=Mycolicibacterium komossense TaxID=1779 RepID=A0ABT3C8H1_9MYCO|nr:PE-PPE domain-containing protein [Mycolicibacterium komossense]MCV7225754.1 PE-PPE domain-containing protein [Mycolicibacterium komossense]
MRRTLVVSMALIGVALAPITVTPTLARAATTALIMGGSGLGDPTAFTNYIPNVADYYIAPNSTCQPDSCHLVPVVTPGGVIPPFIGNLTFDPSVAEGVDDLSTALQGQLAGQPDDQVVIFGYSQSGDIIAKTLRNFTADPTTAPPTDQVSFVVIGNTNRPNGGILARAPGLYVPILNLTFDGAAPTDTGYHTTDIAFRYDPIADFPQYPLNLLADLNSVFAFFTAHGGYPNPYGPGSFGLPLFATTLPDGYTADELRELMADPANRQTYGDTTFITIAPKYLPILQPLVDIGLLTGTSALINPVVDLVQPALTTLIELGYDRTVPYGQPTPFGLIPNVDPGKVASDLAAAVDKGVHDAVADLSAGTATPAVKVRNPAAAPGLKAARTTSSRVSSRVSSPGAAANGAAKPAVTHADGSAPSAKRSRPR